MSKEIGTLEPTKPDISEPLESNVAHCKEKVTKKKVRAGKPKAAGRSFHSLWSLSPKKVDEVDKTGPVLAKQWKLKRKKVDLVKCVDTDNQPPIKMKFFQDATKNINKSKSPSLQDNEQKGNEQTNIILSKVPRDICTLGMNHLSPPESAGDENVFQNILDQISSESEDEPRNKASTIQVVKDATKENIGILQQMCENKTEQSSIADQTTQLPNVRSVFDSDTEDDDCDTASS